jgi:hypothetical protein
MKMEGDLFFIFYFLFIFLGLRAAQRVFKLAFQNVNQFEAINERVHFPSLLCDAVTSIFLPPHDGYTPKRISLDSQAGAWLLIVNGQ